MYATQIAKTLRRIATLLELKGENTFKIRAFTQAADILESREESIEQLLELLEQKAIKGIGPQLTATIVSLHQGLPVSLYEELKQEFPEGLFEILKIPGLGAKKVGLLFRERNIDSIPALKEACESGSLISLKGFGAKTIKNILTGITHLEEYAGQFRYDVAYNEAQELLTYLEKSEDIQEVSIAGSLRRKKETVKDVDIIASSLTAEKVMDYFVQYPKASNVRAQGMTKSAIVLSSGLSVDLRVVSPEEYGSALLHFTGSKTHNTQLRSRALSRGYSLSEYGLHKEEQTIQFKHEQEVYHALDLCMIPPELREGRDELFQAEQYHHNQQKWPQLIQSTDIKGILHAHTTYSDGSNTLRELALAVKSMGYQYLGVTDHSKTAVYAQGLSVDDVKRQHEEIEMLNAELPPFVILKGIESDILTDGSLDYDDNTLEQFDFIIASIHQRGKLSREAMTERVIRAIAHPATKILGHPTGRLLLQREPYEIDMHAVLEAAARHNTAIELNANPRRLDLDWRLLDAAKKLGIPIPICPDAHSIEGIHDMQYGLGMAMKGGLTAEDVLNAWSIEKTLSFFRKT